MSRRSIAALYLALLLASSFYRRTRAPDSLPPGLIAYTVTATPDPVTIAYRDTAPLDQSAAPVLLVHGSPGDHSIFDGLAASVCAHRRCIVPDLPGFGHSTRRLPDYSFRAHARHLLALMDALHLQQAHLAGFSMGGGVVLSIAGIAPDRVASISMLSAIGVQEREMLGGYRTNHILHGLQLSALWTLFAAVPHFGALDRQPLNLEYARNFFDSDQRPLRAILARYRGPMLIVHGASDPLVPVAAALEHHRLVPQSRLVIVPGNHFLLFQHPATIAAPLAAFLDSITGDRAR